MLACTTQKPTSIIQEKTTVVSNFYLFFCNDQHHQKSGERQICVGWNYKGLGAGEGKREVVKKR